VAAGIAASYYASVLLGELMTHAAPRTMGKRFRF